MQKQIAPFGVRMPNDLKVWVQETARREKRSANSQIVHLLEEAKEKAAGGEFGDTAPAAGTDQKHGQEAM